METANSSKMFNANVLYKDTQTYIQNGTAKKQVRAYPNDAVNRSERSNYLKESGC